MLRNLIILFSLSPLLSFGQAKDRFSLAFHILPEVTEYKNNYSFRWDDTYTKASFNIGVEGVLQYDLNNRFYLEGGLGFISREFNTVVFFNLKAIPPPRQYFADILMTSHTVVYQTLQLPFRIGYNWVNNKTERFYLNAGITGNFLMSADYNIRDKAFQGPYHKNYWQGHTVQLGAGIDFNVSHELWITFGVSVSLSNPVKKDPYLFSQDEDELALKHTYQNLSLGIKIPLDH